MNVQNHTLTQSSETLVARSGAYAMLSALFSPPYTETFRLLLNEQDSQSLPSSCELLDPGLGVMAREVFEAIHRSDIEEEYVKVFGHTVSRDVSPYELEFQKNKEVFSMTQALADINGFYQAFGLQLDVHERADHISVEAEFISYLLWKQALAVENEQPENADICAGAYQAFQRDHFQSWAQDFARKLNNSSDSQFYRLASGFLLHLLELNTPRREEPGVLSQ